MLLVKKENSKPYNTFLALAFSVLTLLFIMLMFISPIFFDWAFARHHNPWSWYIRPLFLIPFCYFAYKRSWSGILGTLFLLMTSMFWFPAPEAANDQVSSFLLMEKEYLTGAWGWTKVLISLLIPASLTILGMAFWKRSLWLGISVLVFIAAAKMLWSFAFGGASGRSVMIPAILGLIVCIVSIYIGFMKLEKRK